MVTRAWLIDKIRGKLPPTLLGKVEIPIKYMKIAQLQATLDIVEHYNEEIDKWIKMEAYMGGT